MALGRSASGGEQGMVRSRLRRKAGEAEACAVDGQGSEAEHLRTAASKCAV